MYSWHNPPNPDFAATVPGIPSTSASCILPVPGTTPSYVLAFNNSNDGHAVATALANADPANAANPTIRALDGNGNLLGSAQISLPAQGHTSFMLTDKIPADAGQVGAIIVSADLTTIGALALQVFPNGTISTILPLGQ